MTKLLDTLGVAIARAPGIGLVFIGILKAIRRYSVRVMRRVDKHFVRPREWSNAELAKIAPLYSGTVINVSGWLDEDQRGKLYRSYFSSASGYFVSNFTGARAESTVASVQIDLTRDIPPDLVDGFDVVFNHTTLEHVFEFHKAFENLCTLSRDTVILVTPFIQQVHFSAGSYGDYWRFTPMCLRRMFEENGLSVVYQSANDNEWYISYVFTVATKHPERWKTKISMEYFTEAVGNRLLCIEHDGR